MRAARCFYKVSVSVFGAVIKDAGSVLLRPPNSNGNGALAECMRSVLTSSAEFHVSQLL